ncbi:hypothetical protein FXO38_33909 [Capsicum annuum]|nr:hypothetical protein FXO38_33909 [Capsicum annuum]KAF3632090.1 hypothetical protein FXO37_27676 [Capsicum annuum]
MLGGSSHTAVLSTCFSRDTFNRSVSDCLLIKVHSRFSMCVLSHNGEINTLQGSVKCERFREKTCKVEDTMFTNRVKHLWRAAVISVRLRCGCKQQLLNVELQVQHCQLNRSQQLKNCNRRGYEYAQMLRLKGNNHLQQWHFRQIPHAVTTFLYGDHYCPCREGHRASYTEIIISIPQAAGITVDSSPPTSSYEAIYKRSKYLIASWNLIGSLLHSVLRDYRLLLLA